MAALITLRVTLFVLLILRCESRLPDWPFRLHETFGGCVLSSEKVPVQVSAREGYKVKKSRTGKAVMVFGFPMSLEEMDTVRAEFESQLAYQSRIMREDRMMRF